MKTRCRDFNPEGKNYSKYAGRGILYPAHWENFSGFLADMGECPFGLTLDRKDNDKSYSKENCRWATYSEQNLNRRTPRNNTTGIKGVALHKVGWQVIVKEQNRSRNLYSGNDFFLACCIRKSWEAANIR